jgi:hypothetical protein
VGCTLERVSPKHPKNAAIATPQCLLNHHFEPFHIQRNGKCSYCVWLLFASCHEVIPDCCHDRRKLANYQLSVQKAIFISFRGSFGRGLSISTLPELMNRHMKWRQFQLCFSGCRATTTAKISAGTCPHYLLAPILCSCLLHYHMTKPHGTATIHLASGQPDVTLIGHRVT